jgi:S1-C subfamily serine protease
VNLLDLLLLLLALSAAVGGYRLGFFARVVSWLGLAVGVVVGYNVLPGLLRRLEGASRPSLVMVAVATLLGAGLVGQGLGLTLGSKLNIGLPEGSARTIDRGAGAIAGIVGVVIGLWLLLPILASARGYWAGQVYGSTITSEVHDVFPDPPDTMQALRRLFGDDVFPLVFGFLDPAPNPGKPPVGTGLTDVVFQDVVRSTVKVQGVACRRVQEGSGFVAGDGLVVTNAHVVAGEDETQVELNDGSMRDATVVAFDPTRDLAVLRVKNLDRPALDLRDAQVDDAGGVFGHPGGGPLDVSPFKVAEEITAVGTDIYDRAESRRKVLVLASDLAPGDSGSGLVDPQGDVIGVAFAVAPDKDGVAYALSLEELRPVLAGDLTQERDTGDCLV